jgi:uncharacterized protein YodC (DUF2158 family)
MAKQIKVGSIVKLKSGGPKMTVEAVFRDVSKETYVQCSWFEGDKRVEGQFGLEAIETVEITPNGS